MLDILTRSGGWWRRPIHAAGLAGFIALAGTSMSAQVSVTTWHNDNARTGQNLSETVLTTANVNSSQFGKLFSQAVDSYVYAQPLYLPNVVIGGATHNVVYVATAHDSVYAFDADSNSGGNSSPLWFASMLSTSHGAAAGATTISANIYGTDIYPEVGITGTPVIDSSSGTLYVVSATLEGGNYIQRLHALDVTTGAEKFGGPVLITASVSGTGNGSVGGTLTFDPEWENQRPGLLLLNGIVYIGFAAHEDNGDWHGWILGYSASTLKQTGAFCATPNGTAGGFWMGGAGLAAEVIDPVNHPYGRMFVASGNGDYTASSPYKFGMDFGDSVMNLDLTNGAPTIQDEFTPSYQASLDANDGDQGAGGVLILPPQTTGSYPHLLVQAGKQGEVYLLNREGLGGYNATDQVVQGLPFEVGKTGTWTSPAYWNGTVYYWGQFDTLKAFSLTNGQLVMPPATSTETYAFPGATPAISANGNTNGIVWTIDAENFASSGSAILQAHDASNPGTTLYSSSTNSSRDNPGGAVKFTVPTIANGKVYVGAEYEISVYGLLNGSPVAAAPTLTPGSETFSGSLQVSMSDTTTGATIYYTTDGSTPTVASSVYSTPITITGTTTVNAIATASGYLDSAVTSATYTSSAQVSAPTFSPAGGTYTQTTPVTISDATSGATIYYTNDGTTPTTSSSVYTSPISVNVSETLEAIAVKSGYTNSPVASATYTIITTLPAPTFQPGAGTYTTSQTVTISDATPGTSIVYTTNGTAPTTSSPLYINPITVSASETLEAMAVENGYNNSPVASAVYTINPVLPTPTFSPAAGTYTTTQTVTISDTTSGTTIYYTTNGSTPTTSSSTYGGPITVSATETVKAMAVKSGFTNSAVGAALYTINPMLPAPTFSPGGGTYSSAQTVTISDATSGTSIYYTTNGTTPTTSSTLYAGPVTVSSSETLEAIAVESGYTNSPTGSAAYTINLAAAATPTFSPGAGTYSSTQSVTISDSTAGAKIYYTTNGTTPTTSSTVYGGPITVNSNETLEAIATASGYTQSSVGTAAYTINLAAAATPTFSPGAGTYSSTQSVTISDSTPGATIYYTTNGTTPTTSSSVYGGPVTVSSSETLEAIATASGYTQSSVGTAAYTINLAAATPTFSPGAGTYSSAQTVTISDSTAGAKIYYTTNGTTPTTSSTVYGGPVTVSSSETLEAIATASGYTQSSVGTAAYTINLAAAATPTFSPGAGTYSSAQSVTISDTTPTAVIYYTTNGATPTTSSTKYTGAIAVSSTVTLEAIATASGYSQSAVGSAAYTIKTTPTVSVSPSPSSISNDQSLSVGVTVSGGAGSPTPTGSVTIASGNYTSSPATLSNGSATIAIAAGTLGTGTDTLTASYTPDSSSSGTYNTASNSATVTVTQASYTVTATAVSVSPGTPGTSTITVTSTNGYAGTVSFACALTSSPGGAADLPTCSESQTVTLGSGSSSGTAVATINTTAAGLVSLSRPESRKGIGGAAGGAALALLLLFGIPSQRRKWRSMFLVLVALAAIGSLASCGGVTGTVQKKKSNLGTTAGTYTFTVTGTGNDANKTTATGTITLTVN